MRIDALQSFLPESLFRQAAGQRHARHRQARDRRAGAARSRRTPAHHRFLPRLQAGDFARRRRRWNRSPRAIPRWRSNSPRSAMTAWPSFAGNIRISSRASWRRRRSPRRMPGSPRPTRAINELGACGTQIFTNVEGKPLDRPEFRPFFAAMEKLDKPIWVHPSRSANFPDYLDEKKSLYEIWWAFGWAYETAAMMSRLVFSKILDDMPKLKVIVHHFGSIVPTLEGRVGPGWDQLGARTSDEDYGALLKSLKKRPLDYFKHDFYPDTATFTSEGAMKLRLRLLRFRQGDFRVRLPVRSGKGHDVYPRDLAHPRQLRNAESRSRQGLLQEPGADHRQEVRLKHRRHSGTAERPDPESGHELHTSIWISGSRTSFAPE